MRKKKTFAVLCAILVANVLLAMPVSAQQAPLKPVAYSNGIIQPFWNIADYAELYLSFPSGKVLAEIDYSAPGGASASMSITISEKAPGSSNWIPVASSNKNLASCSAKAGYQYKASATLTLIMNGTKDVIPLSDGPYTA